MGALPLRDFLGPASRLVGKTESARLPASWIDVPRGAIAAGIATVLATAKATAKLSDALPLQDTASVPPVPDLLGDDDDDDARLPSRVEDGHITSFGTAPTRRCPWGRWRIHWPAYYYPTRSQTGRTRRRHTRFANRTMPKKTPVGYFCREYNRCMLSWSTFPRRDCICPRCSRCMLLALR